MTGPTKELGGALPEWTNFGPGFDDVPNLVWPQSIDMFSKMRLDGQIEALTKAITLPILRRRFAVDKNGAKDEVVEHIAKNLGLPIVGEEDEPRGRRRFSHHDHLRHALLGLWYGHMFFNQVGEVTGSPERWHLRKLAPRMPRSIQTIHVAEDGGLEGITQVGYRPPPTQSGRGTGRIVGLGSGVGTLITNPKPQIPVTSLVAYVWEREGPNWLGRSMLRPLYRDWVLKDRALRVDAIKNERFGAGIPTGTAPVGGDPVEYQRMAAAIRAAENGGVGLPNGGTIAVNGISGSLPDVLASIRYYDESMARTFLAMFAQLGQTQTGSRALGETFVDFFTLALDAITDWYLDVLNEHVVEDIVDWNWGEDADAPRVIALPRSSSEIPVADLVALISAGVIAADKDVESWVRERYSLPEKVEEEPPPTPIAVPTPTPTDGTLPTQDGGQQPGQQSGPAAVPAPANKGGVAAGDARPKVPGFVGAHLPGQHNQATHGHGGRAATMDHARGGTHAGYASSAEHAEAIKLAEAKIENAPVPSAAAVAKSRDELAKAKAGMGRAGGDARGGSAKDRRKQRENLFKEFEAKDASGNGKGYVVCPHTALKMHWTDDPGLNPNGYPLFERGKIFTKWQGGGYQMPNLLPESFAANRARNDTMIRSENVR